MAPFLFKLQFPTNGKINMTTVEETQSIYDRGHLKRLIGPPAKGEALWELWWFAQSDCGQSHNLQKV